ncbi:hypothetical protein SAMN02744133_10829 [Thalassospira xiamenensis M-5 = DSM 17429]|uniref:Uncharacterized protein n=1 Tax=Thalassospira xiamenensis M-5 = DSM 17429 TaxID=1123366 RepID=A0AB72UL13_9PROT|nr:hypothetical protein [Thalassospira xiamenensis]AJD54308.1 hypothetical protein TH3_21178 [Thalassospira xiamenensis M-5 = DSM 17429]SIT21033.1 hypothetical protein SAMN02744133_10829 [Thalassospira xiamenensis M-5 = DSM 17429]
MSTTEDFRDLSDDSLPLPEMNPPIAASLHDAEFISALGVIAGTENVDQVLLAKFLPHIRQLLEMTTVSAIQSRDVFDYQEIRASGGESGYCMGLLVALYPSCYGVTTRDSAKVLYPEQIIAIERANWAHDRQVDFSLKNLLEALFWLSRVPEAQHLPAILGAAHSTLKMAISDLKQYRDWGRGGVYLSSVLDNLCVSLKEAHAPAFSASTPLNINEQVAEVYAYAASLNLYISRSLSFFGAALDVRSQKDSNLNADTEPVTADRQSTGPELASVMPNCQI